ncbi:MAG: hypothetical protein U1F36_20035 [Planctomycetota bacterium]
MRLCSSLLFVAALAACAVHSAAVQVAPPLAVESSAYETAGRIQLPQRKPDESPSLHNVFRLSDNIVSGSEPEGDAGFRQIAAMGVKTILSVDGKAPDAERAERFGLRYVHIPIRYKGIESNEVEEIAKTFRELPGPFYVHCFHGKHRGPAAAAIGRLVLDGVARDEAIAEMRQWCGTSKSYEGLYATIATGVIPSAAETAAVSFDFPAAHRYAGFRQVMIDLPRSYDALEEIAKNQWKPRSDHPDANALNEARRMAETFTQSRAIAANESRPQDFQAWLEQCEVASTGLVSALEKLESGDATAAEVARARMADVKQRCDACHKTYRN